MILLADKIGQEMEGQEDTTENVVARDTFRFVGTMNPGGDYGKKELSLVLKKQFTEIWPLQEQGLAQHHGEEHHW